MLNQIENGCTERSLVEDRGRISCDDYVGWQVTETQNRAMWMVVANLMQMYSMRMVEAASMKIKR